jgi:uncharacterized protein (DUF433 family)
MSMTFPTTTIPIRTDERGAIRVGNTRVLLDVVIARYQQGDAPERIQEAFPTLKLADIYAVISYYLNQQDEVDAYLQGRREAGEALRRKIEAEQPRVKELRARLRAQRDTRQTE